MAPTLSLETAPATGRLSSTGLRTVCIARWVAV